MINEPTPFEDLGIKITIITPIMGKVFINHGFGLGFRIQR